MGSKIKLISYEVVCIPVIGRKGSDYKIGPCSVILRTSAGTYKLTVENYFYTDGISGTRLTHKVLPAWKPGDSRYNACGVVHDILYEYKGFGIFTRDDCDAIFRGMLREYGMSRIVASTADFVLGIAAARHWGPDGHNASDAVCIWRL